MTSQIQHTLMNKYLYLAVIIFSCYTTLSGCSNKKNTKNNLECLHFRCIKDQRFINVMTNKGVMKIEIYGADAPVTSGNFIDLVTRGVYENTLFHKVIKEPIPLVVVGGDPTTQNKRNLDRTNTGLGNFINKDTNVTRYIPLEIKVGKEIHPRYREPITDPNDLKRITLKHVRGSLGMMRNASPNSGSAQFYIALKKLPELDGRYAVFGKVVEGLETLDKLNKGDRLIRVISK